MANYNYQCTFNLKDCIKKIGLEEKGRVQQVVTNTVQELCDPYIPFKDGNLKTSGHIENKTEIVWNTVYAHYMWEGIVYEDPNLHCAGFKVKDGGWRSRKNVQKVPTTRKLKYYNGALRGPKWVDRMLQNGGQKQIEDIARKEAGK